jgi:DNA-binding CsgD family transcriptional regulator
VFGASGGCPFLVVAILRELSASVVASGGLARDVVETLAPVQVGRALLARVAALPADGASLLALLEAVAVIGPEADLSGCAHLAGLDPTLAAVLVDCLVDDGLLSPRAPLRFEQDAVGTATLQEMGSARRARLHLAAARLLEQRERPAEVVANHLLLAEHCADQWAARRLEEAGRQALARGDQRTALSFLEKALSEYPRTAGASLHVDMARATAAADLTAADRHLSRAVALGADLREVADAALGLARGAPEGEAVPALVTTLRKTAARLPGPERDLRVRLEVAAAELALSSTVTAQAREIIESLLGPSQTSTTSAQRLGLAFLALVGSADARRRSAAEVTDLLSRALSPKELISGDPWEVRFRAKALLALARAGSFDHAEKLASAALQQGREGNNPAAAVEYSVARAGALLFEGRLAEAEAEAFGALSEMEGRPWVTRPLALACLAEALVGQARTTEAHDVLAGAHSEPPTPGTDSRYLSEQRGHVLLLLGRADDAWREFELAKLWAEHDGIDNPAVTSWRSGMAACLKAQGRAEEALALAEENLALARAFGAPWLIGKALIELAAVSSRPERLSVLADAVLSCEASGAPLFLATALIELGTELGRDSEQRREAVEVLHRGARFASSCGAVGLVDRAASALRAAGARPRRLGLRGREALTPAEERVATVACAGHTNAEIASRLFLSEKTVEGHLARVYRKLGVRSRQEMAEQLREHAPS